MYKMVVFDIDGTLVPHLTNEFSEEIIDMFKQLKENNMIITLATGRDWISIKDLYQNPYIDYFIGANGSFIYDLKNQKYIFNSSIKWEEFDLFNEQVLMPNLHNIKSVILSDDNRVFVLENKVRTKPWFWDAFKHKFQSYENAKNELNKNNFHLITIEFKYGTDVVEKCADFFDKNNTKIYVQASWPKGLFVANKGVTKAHSIAKLCEHINIDLKNVIAFGDGENDFEMIKEVGLGIAMGNAIDELKNVADDVTIDVYNCGTKFYCKKIGVI